jgi:hypothetical protein
MTTVQIPPPADLPTSTPVEAEFYGLMTTVQIPPPAPLGLTLITTTKHRRTNVANDHIYSKNLKEPGVSDVS